MEEIQQNISGNALETEGIKIDRPLGGKVNIILDMSMWDLFELCKARYYMRYQMNRSVPVSKKSPSLDSGGLAHEGLDVYFSLLKQGVHYNDRMQAALMKIKEVSSDPDQCNLNMDDVNRVLSAIEESCDFWRFEDEMMIIHEVERPFLYVLFEDDDVRIMISGKIDVLVDIPPLGGSSGYKNIPIDHKTFARDFEVSRLTNQFQNYCVATNSNYLIVNRIGLHDPDAKKPKPAEEKFKRVPLSYDPYLLEDWKANTTYGILTEYLACIGSGVWRMNFMSCYAFSRRCEYFEICDTSGADNKLYKLNNDYILTSPWDVTAKLKKD